MSHVILGESRPVVKSFTAIESPGGGVVGAVAWCARMPSARQRRSSLALRASTPRWSTRR